MLQVKTEVKASEVHGMGLFAAEPIKKGEVVWVFEPGLDISITKDEYEALKPVQKTFFDHYGYWSNELERYICAADGWRYTNHSEDANVVTIGLEKGSEGQDVALRDIEAGEELLFDYRGFGEDPTLN